CAFCQLIFCHIILHHYFTSKDKCSSVTDPSVTDPSVAGPSVGDIPVPEIGDECILGGCGKLSAQLSHLGEVDHDLPIQRPLFAQDLAGQLHLRLALNTGSTAPEIRGHLNEHGQSKAAP